MTAPISAGSLSCYRLIWRLAQREGSAFIRVSVKLAEMLNRTARQVWRYIRELREAGMIQSITDGRMSYIKPLAGPMKAPSGPAKCHIPCHIRRRLNVTSAPSALSITDRREETTTQTTQAAQDLRKLTVPVVVSSPSAASAADVEPAAVNIAAELVPPAVAVRIAAGHSAEAMRRAVAVVKAYTSKRPARCLPALLRSALVEKWQAATPPSPYASDRGKRTVRYVTAPPSNRRETPPQPLLQAPAEGPHSLSSAEDGQLVGKAAFDALRPKLRFGGSRPSGGCR